MASDGEFVMWSLVPPLSPPSAPALHRKAKGKPFALLQTLDPLRGPDYFPMQKMRPLWHNHDRSFTNSNGLHSFSARGSDSGGHSQSTGRPDMMQNLSEREYLSGTASDDRDASILARKRGEGRGIPAFSASPPSSYSGTPFSQRQAPPRPAAPSTPLQHQHQQGFSLFGGKAHSTPSNSVVSSGDRQSPAASPPLRSLSGTARADGGMDSDRGSHHGSGNGLSRFRTLAQQTREQEEQQERRRTGNFGGRGSGFMDSASKQQQQQQQQQQALRTLPTSNRSVSSGQIAAAAPTTAGRKRLRPPSPAATSQTSATVQSPPAAVWPPRPRSSVPPSASTSAQHRRDGAPPVTPPSTQRNRTWDGVDGGSGRAQPGSQQRSPRATSSATAGRGGKDGVTPTPRRSRSPRVSNTSQASLRGRGRGGEAGSGSTSQAPMPPPLPRRYTLADFAGADEVCFNPGASTQGLSIFLERCEARGTVALTLLWADLTTSYSAVTVKSCVPSQQCSRWNCPCGRQTRASQATAPLIGAIVYLPPDGEGLTQRVIPSEKVSKGGGGYTGSSQETEFAEGETYLLPLGACDGEDEEAAKARGYQLPIQCQVSYNERWQALAKLMAMPIKKVAFNAQVALMPLIAWSRRPRSATITASQGTSEEEGCGKTGDGSRAPPQVTVSGLFDPRVAAWMADTGSTDKALEFETLCVSWIKSGATTAPALSTDGKSTIVAAVLRAEDCCRRSLALSANLSAELERTKMLSACEEVEMPVIPVLAGMEVSGVVFLPERVTRFSEALDSRLEGLRQTAIDTAGGRQFNLASPEQVADILFKHLKLPSPPLKAGSTHASTSAEVLDGLLEKHPVVAPILEFRGVNKYKTTYIDKLAEKAVGAAVADSAIPASQATGAMIIRAAWHQTSVRTGRLSCSRPNLQQIPKGSDPLAGVTGVNVRDAFVASKSFTLMAADYSQIEMRVLADACRDPGLAKLFSFAKGATGDVYRRLAAQVFNKEEKAITDHERNRAKVVCLGIIYVLSIAPAANAGMGTPQVARKLEVTDSQAQGLVRSFLRTFPGIEPFMATTRRCAREHGYVCTLTGRRRHLPQINNSHSAALKAQAERQAVNSVVQGTAADIMKTAMVLVARRLDEWRSTAEDGLDCPRLIMQIHDELLLECPAREEHLKRLKGLLTECMEVEAPAVLGIKCPLTVNMLVGMSWGSMRRVVSHDEGDDAD